MISARKIMAISLKDAKSLLYNMFILSGILIVPVMAFVLNLTADDDVYVMPIMLMVVQMNVLMNGANIICVMIAEEKEKHTLNVLKSSTVSGLDFLFSKLLVTVVLTAIVTALIFFMFRPENIALLPFMLITTIAILPTAAIGAIIGIATKTQAAASSAVAPVALIFMFLPLVIPYDAAIWDVLDYLFVQQLVIGVRNIYDGYAYLGNIGIILANFVVLFAVFLLYYKKKGLVD